MRFQDKTFSCGAAAVVNAARALGKRVSERKTRTLAFTDDTGTGNEGVIAAARSLGYAAVGYDAESRNHAWRWLRGALLQGSVVIMAVDQWAHWVACIGMLGERVILVDSSNMKKNKQENGVHVLSKERLMQRWWYGRRSEDYPLYGICISKNRS